MKLSSSEGVSDQKVTSKQVMNNQRELGQERNDLQPSHCNKDDVEEQHVPVAAERIRKVCIEQTGKRKTFVLSWTTKMVHSRDEEDYGVNHEVNSPKISYNFLRWWWGRVTKLKQPWPEMLSKSCYGIFKKKLFSRFSTDWLTNCLMPSDSFNLTKATG